ncbi:hypothetical protein [Pseudobacillus badius]|uniref:hypothetical protein n=1 Tax=Bacillus badius TaxID=1455 RepID=UPI0007B3D71A|nr:hypothetical protein [Bacillus badius]KZR57497.1 hypothetical protein A3781_19915 [Bacillus badius]
MKIGELLELTKIEPLDKIAKERLTIGKMKAREAMKAAGCYSKNGVRGWFYDGPPELLERSIYEFVEGGQQKARPNVRTNKQKNNSSLEQKQHSTRKNQRANKKSEPTNVIAERTNVIRKRSSFDLDVEVMKRLKIQAIVHDRTVYEIVETAIKKYLDELEK